MTDTVSRMPSRIQKLPSAVILPSGAPGRRLPGWVRLPSLVWLVPAVAALIGVWLAIHALRQRGPTVTITFATAEGLEAHRTTIKYKSVNIGTIKSVDLLADRSGVVVTAELTRQVEGLLVDDARFWVVRPRVSVTGVSGIGTLISGAHIGFDRGSAEKSRRDFVGLEAPPTTISDRRGQRFVLHASDAGSLDVGSPVYLRRLQVGQVTRLALDQRGEGVGLEVFVDAPHDQQVTTQTRFWNASGVDLSLSTRGLRLDTQSLASVLLGGVAFETPPDGTDAAPAGAGADFTLYPGRDTAMRSPGSPANRYALVFQRPVRGLAPGSPVELAGGEVGEVLTVEVELDARTTAPRTVVMIGVQPNRLRVRSGASVAAPSNDREARALLERMVARGLRARVRTGNLVTGQRYVSLDVVAGARPVRIDWRRQPGQLPTLDGDGDDDLPAALARLASRLEQLPLEDLAREGTLAARELRGTLAGATRLMNQIDTQLAPQVGAMLQHADRTLGALDSAAGTLAPDAPLPSELRGLVRDLGGAGQAVRTLADYLERHPESLLMGKKKDRP